MRYRITTLEDKWVGDLTSSDGLITHAPGRFLWVIGRTVASVLAMLKSRHFKVEVFEK
jgi:hypothetical protein